MDSEFEMARQREAIKEVERRARADARIFRRAGWVWSAFCGSLLLGMGVAFLDARYGTGFDVYLMISMATGSMTLVLFVPAGITAMQVVKVVLRHWRASRRGEG